MNVGIIGFGKMGMLHGALLNALPDARLVAVADKSKLVLNAFKSVTNGIHFYNSHEAMLERESLAAVIITTPTNSHVDIAKEAVRRGIHIFVEKPLSMTSGEAEALNTLVKAQGVVGMVGYHMRLLPTFAKGKELLETGIIGRILEIDAQLFVSDVFEEQHGWRYNPKISGGGVCIDFAVHLLDMLMWYCGDVAAISATTRSMHSKNVEDEVKAEILFKQNSKAKIHVSWSEPFYRLPFMKITLQGEKGSLTATDHGLLVNIHNEKPLKYSIADLYAGYYLDIAGPAYSLQMQAFADAIRSRKPLHLDHAVKVQKIVDKIYLAAKSGTTVEVS